MRETSDELPVGVRRRLDESHVCGYLLDPRGQNLDDRDVDAGRPAAVHAEASVDGALKGGDQVCGHHHEVHAQRPVESHG